MSFLIKYKTASGNGSFVVSYFSFYNYISRLGFISFLGFVLLRGTKRVFSVWRLLLFLLFFRCVHVCYRKKTFSMKIFA